MHDLRSLHDYPSSRDRMSFQSERVAAPAVPIVSLADIRDHVRVVGTDDDAYLTGLVAAAQAHFEGPNTVYRSAFTPQTWRDSFQDLLCLRLVLQPVSSIVSVTYFDADNVEQTINAGSYYLARMQSGERVMFLDSVPPVTLANRADPVRVTYQVGYETVPDSVVHAVKLLVGHWFNNRESVSMPGEGRANPVPQTVDFLMQQFRRY